MDFEEDIIREVPNEDSLDISEKMILFDEIKKLKPKVVVETGTHKGLTSLYLASALRENGEGHLHTADPYEWGALGNFRKFPELDEYITYYQIPGKDLKVDNIDLLFIDGYHEKVEVVAEIKALFPRLSPNAIVYFHDTNDSLPTCDVPGAIEEMGLKVKYLKTINGMARYDHNRNTNNKR